MTLNSIRFSFPVMVILACVVTCLDGCSKKDTKKEPDEIVAMANADHKLAIEYDLSWQMRLAEHYYKKAYDALVDPSMDWFCYSDAGYRYAYLLYRRGEVSQAMDVVSSLLQKSEHNKDFPMGLKIALHILMAEIQIDLRMPENAEKSFERAYKEERRLVQKKGDDPFNLLVVCCDVYVYYFSTENYSRALTWLNRVEDELHEYEQEGDSLLIEEYRGRLALYKATYMQRTGQPAKAAAIYASIPRSQFNNVTSYKEAAEYLMEAGRFEEAADMYDSLDSIFKDDSGTDLTFDAIDYFLAPRYYANRHAFRDKKALEIADDLYEAIDTALARQKRNDASELAILYKTHEKELEIKDANTTARIHRILFYTALLVILLIAYLLRRAYMYNKVLKEKNRILYQQIKQREHDEEKEMEKLEAQPEENLSHNQKLYRRICELMNQSDVYTDPDTNHETLARLLGTNYAYIYEALRECAGQTPADFINQYRLRHAAQLLTSTDEPVGLVIEMSGITNRSTFSRLFREHYSMSPTEYRKAASM